MTHRVELWDRQSPVNGMPPETVLESLPETLHVSGPIVLVIDDETDLAVVLQAWDPTTGEGGFPAFVDDDTALAWGREVADLRDNPPDPIPVEQPPAETPGPTAEDFAQMRADLDWVINFAVTGEA
jgi:hypothetical protein